MIIIMGKILFKHRIYLQRLCKRCILMMSFAYTNCTFNYKSYLQGVHFMFFGVFRLLIV